ncbi:hypothetical protein [Rubricoccus marinus]|uniref:Glycosyltransferase RgtA/B/C/D-like domain-containing protein n=1 Tax=Rubricoccus marinus TaxID=716817 RepID=A0A259TWI0_9BACT|nr:hypothetical protein [Rubricoccus marinus]OZC02050.1 hypothetical protein BSZ36_03065 [Rubricoccus marinus]
MIPRPPTLYLLLVGLLLAAAWTWGALAEPSGWGDTEDYTAQADNLLAGRGWSTDTPEATRDDPRLASRRLPGYGALLAPIRAVSRAPELLALVQSLLALGLAWGLWRVAARLGPDRWRPLALGIALAPAWWIAAQVPLADLPFAALLFVATERVVAFSERQRPRDLALVHVVLAAAFLLKPVLLYFWPVAASLTGWMLWRAQRTASGDAALASGLAAHASGARGYWPVALAWLIPLLALGFAAAHGTQTGHAEVTSLQTQNLWQQNARRAMLRTGDEAEYEATDARLAVIPTYAERQRRTAATAKAAVFERPLAYAAVHMTGVAAFALDPGRYDLALFFELPVGSTGAMDAASRGAAPLARFLGNQPWPLALVLGLLTLWNAAVAVAFLVWCWRGPVSPEVRAWCFLLVAYVAFVTGPVGAARYRLAVVPILLLALPWAWDQFRSRFRHPAA